MSFIILIFGFQMKNLNIIYMKKKLNAYAQDFKYLLGCPKLPLVKRTLYINSLKMSFIFSPAGCASLRPVNSGGGGERL